jgi:hypothetical protein
MDTPEYRITNEGGDAYLNIEVLEIQHICATCAANHRFAEQGNPVACKIPVGRKHFCHFVRRYRERPEFATEMEAVLLAERLYILRKQVNTGAITKRDALMEWGEKRAFNYNDILVDAEYQRIFIDGNI